MALSEIDVSRSTRSVTKFDRELASFWVLADASRTVTRASAKLDSSITENAVCLYRVEEGVPELVERLAYQAQIDLGAKPPSQARLGFDLLVRARVRGGIVVAGQRFLRPALVHALERQGLNFVFAVPSENSRTVFLREAIAEIRENLDSAFWRTLQIGPPESAATYAVTELPNLRSAVVGSYRCLAISTGGIADFRRGLIAGISSLPSDYSLEEIAHLLGWTRWIGAATRRERKKEQVADQIVATNAEVGPSALRHMMKGVPARVNLRYTRVQDQLAAEQREGELFDHTQMRGVLASGKTGLNVIELFAGAGGMGLGFLMAREGGSPYKVLFSGELHPIFVNTLRTNHEFLRAGKLVPDEAVPEHAVPVDLRAPSVMDAVQSISAEHGGVDIVIGGPPCQGFSNANRNSQSTKNPNNKLVDTYLDYVIRLRPRVLLMENVQGVLWTQHHGARSELSVAEHVVARLSRAGYRIFPKLLDAAWYGVPQHRNRFFLLGLHTDLGYAQDDFGEWGPFPRPTHGPGGMPLVTVADAIRDLPAINNGEDVEELPYVEPAFPSEFVRQMRKWAPSDIIWDHVTSKHAEYVLERYRRIPAGGNWSDISDMMTNYAVVERTHSNIYKRLDWLEPSITIGHYRKSMLIHPQQQRGLSLREAARLQSFPDWFRFAGGEQRIAGGLTHRQQQLANAVCPLVTKAVAEYLFLL